MKKISIKKIINISFGFTLLFFAYSCNNEDDVCISEKSETRFDIPQGNHDFDEQIVAWSKDYDINVLYKFTLPDLHIPVDTRSAFPVISVQSPVSIQYRWQS